MIRVLYLFAILLSFKGYAQESAQENGANKEKPAVEQVDTTPLREIGSEYHNGIRLLQNRFRIDYKVDEITMVFFRKFGSAPIVLVRPDGSKIFLSQAEDNDVEWYDSTTYDMIRMKNPTPGPWQAVGQILPGSRVMVLSDIELQAEPLPTVLFSGEILKQTAYLTNGGMPIDYAEFRDVVKLNMDFVSTNNPNFNNFGAQTQTIATFEDNGKGMDERPLDGTFTGQFNLTIPAGEWKPVFTVSTPMFTREQVSEPIILHENPIKVDVKLDDTGSGYHKLMVDADREMIDMGSLLVDGKIRYPNGDVQNFSITRVSDDVRTYDIVNFEYGIFRVKLTAYGNTVDGRDFILDVPEFTFFAEEPELQAGATPKPIESIPEDALSAEAIALQEMKRINQPVVEDDSMPTSTLVKLIIGINLGIIVIGGAVIWFIVSRKKSASTGKRAGKKTFSMPKVDFSAILASLKGLMNKLPKGKPGKKKAKA